MRGRQVCSSRKARRERRGVVLHLSPPLRRYRGLLLVLLGEEGPNPSRGVGGAVAMARASSSHTHCASPPMRAMMVEGKSPPSTLSPVKAVKGASCSKWDSLAQWRWVSTAYSVSSTLATKGMRGRATPPENTPPDTRLRLFEVLRFP